MVKRNEGKDNERSDYEFCYVNSQNFLQNRGFGRLRRQDKSFLFIHLEPPLVRSLEASDVRDYLFQFAKHNCCVGVNEMLIKGVSQYVGPDKLSLLEYIQPDFIKPSRDGQYFYFDKSCWLVTRDSVKEMAMKISHIISGRSRDVTIRPNIWENSLSPSGRTLIRIPMS